MTLRWSPKQPVLVVSNITWQGGKDPDQGWMNPLLLPPGYPVPESVSHILCWQTYCGCAKHSAGIIYKMSHWAFFHVVNENPKLQKLYFRDMHSRQFKLFKKLKESKPCKCFPEQVNKFEWRTCSEFLQLFIFFIILDFSTTTLLVVETHYPEVPVGKAFGLSQAHQDIFLLSGY